MCYNKSMIVSHIKRTVLVGVLILGSAVLLLPQCRVWAQGEVFTVQVLSGHNMTVAVKKLDFLKKKGYLGYIERVKDTYGVEVYKVRVGIFAAEKDARQLKDRLAGDQIDCWVVAVRSPEKIASGTPPDNESTAVLPGKDVVRETDLTASADNGTRPESPVPPDNGSTAAPPYRALVTKTGQMHPPEHEWPSILQKTYKYYDAQGTLHLTNLYENIPRELAGQIKQIVVFPVRLVSFNATACSVQVELEGTIRTVVIDHLKRSEKTPPAGKVRDFEIFVRNRPLRLKYNPAKVDTEGAIRGSLYLNSGRSVAVEIVSRGLAHYESDGIAVYLRKEFEAAGTCAGENRPGSGEQDNSTR